MTIVPAYSRSSPPQNYRDSIDPQHLPCILALVREKLWRGLPDRYNRPPFEVDASAQFHKALEAFKPPKNVVVIDLIQKVYKVQLPLNLLSTIEEKMVQRVLGASSQPAISRSALRSICLKDSSFLYLNIIGANDKCSPLYQFIRESYLHDYQEEPLIIQSKPELIEMAEDEENVWMKCTYTGTIHTQKDLILPFEANCCHNPERPAISFRSIFIDPMRMIF